MAEPWPVTQHPDAPEMWIVEDDSGKSGWLDEQAARRYAALPVLIATIREACDKPRCGFCGYTVYEPGYIHDPSHTHDPDCPGIAALKAAGEEVE